MLGVTAARLQVNGLETSSLYDYVSLKLKDRQERLTQHGLGRM
jgi:hypothetical protein